MITGFHDDIRWGEDSDAYVLADERDAVDAYRLTPDRKAADDSFVGAAAGKTRDLGNTHTVVTFTATRQHATPLAARAYITARAKELAAKTPAARTLHLAYRAGGTETFAVPDATIRRAEGIHRGATTIHTYEIKGGPVS